MVFLRCSPLVLALVALGASTCQNRSEPGEPKPAAPPTEVAVPGVDTSGLTPRERRDWSAQVSELLAPCPDVPVSIAQCVQEQRACKACLPAAQLLLKQVQAGKPRKEREDAFAARFDPKKIKTIVTDGSPSIGPPDAPVTIVEWADFECPFCKLVGPLLEELVERFDGQVRLVFKFYPLESHPNGEIAARAAIAGMNQDKFWPMHHAIFENQGQLSPPDLERYAKKVGLDLPRFRADLTSKETTDRLTKDKNQAEGVGLEGTPMIFINGREVDLKLLTNVYDDLLEWVKLEVELSGQKPRLKPAKTTAREEPAGGVKVHQDDAAKDAPAAKQ